MKAAAAAGAGQLQALMKGSLHTDTAIAAEPRFAGCAGLCRATYDRFVSTSLCRSDDGFVDPEYETV